MSYNRPRVEGFDDETGEPLTKRPDDNPVCSLLYLFFLYPNSTLTNLTLFAGNICEAPHPVLQIFVPADIVLHRSLVVVQKYPRHSQPTHTPTSPPTCLPAPCAEVEVRDAIWNYIGRNMAIAGRGGEDIVSRFEGTG